MKNLVLTYKQMAHLFKLGFIDTKRCKLFWHSLGNLNWLSLSDDIYHEMEGKITVAMPTYTLENILDILPKEIQVNDTLYFLWWSGDVFKYSAQDEHGNFIGAIHETFGGSHLDAAYKMLCWCLENRYIKTK